MTERFDSYENNNLLKNSAAILNEESVLPSTHLSESTKNNLSFDPAVASAIIAFVLCWVIIIHKLSKDGFIQHYEGILTQNTKIKWLVVAALIFILLRGIADIYFAVDTDNALNLIFGLSSLCFGLTVFFEKFRSKFFVLAGIWMLARGIFNIFIFVISTDEIGYVIVNMPISTLPSSIISYILPTAVGVYLLFLYRQQKFLNSKSAF